MENPFTSLKTIVNDVQHWGTDVKAVASVVTELVNFFHSTFEEQAPAPAPTETKEPAPAPTETKAPAPAPTETKEPAPETPLE